MTNNYYTVVFDFFRVPFNSSAWTAQVAPKIIIDNTSLLIRIVTTPLEHRCKPVVIFKVLSRDNA